MRATVVFLLVLGATSASIWDDLLVHLSHGEAVTKAAIVRLNGTTDGTFGDFHPSSEEITTFAKHFETGKFPEKLSINGEEFKVTSGDKDGIRASYQKENLIIRKTLNGAIMTICAEGKMEGCSFQTVQLGKIIKGFGF